MQFFTQGYGLDANAILNLAKFHEPMSEMIIVKDIEVYNLCEHHMLPFWQGPYPYIPNGWITGLSKIPGWWMFSPVAFGCRKTYHLDTTCYPGYPEPLGAAVVIEASHLCMMMRGVQKQNSLTTTSAFYGEFERIRTELNSLSLFLPIWTERLRS